MSRNVLWQICHKKDVDNNTLTTIIVSILRESTLTTKQVSKDLNISTERVRNWYHKDTGMTALDLLRMVLRYECVRQAVHYLILSKTDCDSPESSASVTDCNHNP